MALEVATGLALFESLRSTITLLVDGKVAVGEANLRLQLVDVATKLGRLELEYQASLRKHAELEGEVVRLREALAIKGDVRRFGNAVFLKEGDDWSRPYCLTCWERDARLLSLLRTESTIMIRWECPVCKVALQPTSFPNPRA